MQHLKSALEEKYPDGLNQFKLDFKHGYTERNNEDELLLSFAYMNYEHFSLDGLKENTDYVIVQRWGKSKLPNWLKSNGIYYWHKKYQMKNVQFDKWLKDDITVNQLSNYVSKIPLPDSF